MPLPVDDAVARVYGRLAARAQEQGDSRDDELSTC